MKTMKMLVTFAALSFGLVACGSVEGTYTLDKDATKKSMEADIAKMPADKQANAKMGLAFIDAMDVSMELKSGGVVSSKSTMKGLGDGKEKEEPGTWKKDGDTVTITSGKNNEEMKCTKSGKSLSCSAGEGDHKMTMVFTKA